ncbi:MAG: divergent polysaccharide deacetylase family protein, partial [bacterium]|nr:divergent polysaccharide deacetylase family protein [bacterium]
KRKRSKKRNSSTLFFVLFVAIAVFTVVLLEYIDFRGGKKSFIFTRVIPLQTFSDKVEKFNANFLRILDKNNINCDYHQDDQKRYHFSLQIEASRFNGLLTRIKKTAELLNGKIELSEVQGMSGKAIMLYKVSLGTNVSHWILITKVQKGKAAPPETKPGKEKKPPPTEKTARRPAHSSPGTGGTPRIAIIIDDVGGYEIGALELKKLNIPITASILPDSPRAHEQARWVNQYGLQSMIHLPMQPKNGNGQTYSRTQTITLNSTDEEIRNLLRRSKQIVPHARGVNNHQGSLATANSSLMTRVLKIIKGEGLFFVDSRTIGNSVAYDTAKRLGVKTAFKRVFLDHETGYANALRQMRRLVEIALQEGKAIAIGHPHQSTIDAIRNSLKYVRSRGVKIVYVSELLE